MSNCQNTLTLESADPALEEEIAKFAKAIAHPARVRLLKVLSEGGCLGSDLVDQLELAQSTVSEHLRILKKSGLVDAEVQHPRTCFSLNAEAWARFKTLMHYFD